MLNKLLQLWVVFVQHLRCRRGVQQHLRLIKGSFTGHSNQRFGPEALLKQRLNWPKTNQPRLCSWLAAAVWHLLDLPSWLRTAVEICFSLINRRRMEMHDLHVFLTLRPRRWLWVLLLMVQVLAAPARAHSTMSPVLRSWMLTGRSFPFKTCCLDVNSHETPLRLQFLTPPHASLAGMVQLKAF